jgi:hypothetical protein
MHLSYDLVGKIQPTFDELIFDGSGEQLDDESVGKSNSLVTTAAELSLITGAFFEEAARCVAYPKPWSVKAKHRVACNRLTSCTKQPKRYSWVGTGSLNQATTSVIMQRRWPMRSRFRFSITRTDRQAQLRVWRSGARDCDRDKKATAPVTAIRHVVKYGLI